MASAGLEALPPEVLLIIVQFCRGSRNGDDNEKGSLVPLSLVSRHLGDVTMPILYATIRLNGPPEETESFFDLMARNPERANMVKALLLNMNRAQVRAKLDLTPLRALKDLQLRGCEVPYCIDYLSGEYGIFPCLESCYIDFQETGVEPDFRSFGVDRLMSLWTSPNLRRFEISGECFHLVASPAPKLIGDGSDRPSVKLKDVEVLGIAACHVDRDAFEQLMAVRKCQRFSYATSAKPVTHTDFDMCAHYLAAHVTSLQYAWDFRGSEFFTDADPTKYPDLSMFTKVHALEISGQMLISYRRHHLRRFDPWMLSKLPPLLERLTIDIDSQRMRRCQFYRTLTRLLEAQCAASARLRDVTLLFRHETGMSPEHFWSDRLVSEVEQDLDEYGPLPDIDSGHVDENARSGTNGYTHEHTALMETCDRLGLTLETARWKWYRDEDDI